MLERNLVLLNLSETHKTVENIQKRKAFTISIADKAHVKEAVYFGVVSGNTEKNKLEKTGLTYTKSSNVDAPIINELPVCMECTYLQSQNDEYSYGVIGKVVNVSANEEVMANDNVDITKLHAICYDSFTHGYYEIGSRVGNAFKDGLELK